MHVSCAVKVALLIFQSVYFDGISAEVGRAKGVRL